MNKYSIPSSTKLSFITPPGGQPQLQPQQQQQQQQQGINNFDKKIQRHLYDKSPSHTLLQDVSMAELTGVVRQLAELSSFANKIFDELQNLTKETVDNVNSLKTRTDRLTQTWPQIKKVLVESDGPRDFYSEGGGNSSKNQASKNIHASKTTTISVNRSVTVTDKDGDPRPVFFGPGTRPDSVRSAFMQCQPLPDVRRLDTLFKSISNPSNENETYESCVKKYSNPDFFYDQWKKEEIDKMVAAAANNTTSQTKKSKTTTTTTTATSNQDANQPEKEITDKPKKAEKKFTIATSLGVEFVDGSWKPPKKNQSSNPSAAEVRAEKVSSERNSLSWDARTGKKLAVYSKPVGTRHASIRHFASSDQSANQQRQMKMRSESSNGQLLQRNASGTIDSASSSGNVLAPPRPPRPARPVAPTLNTNSPRKNRPPRPKSQDTPPISDDAISKLEAARLGASPTLEQATESYSNLSTQTQPQSLAPPPPRPPRTAKSEQSMDVSTQSMQATSFIAIPEGFNTSMKSDAGYMPFTSSQMAPPPPPARLTSKATKEVQPTSSRDLFSSASSSSVAASPDKPMLSKRSPSKKRPAAPILPKQVSQQLSTSNIDSSSEEVTAKKKLALDVSTQSEKMKAPQTPTSDSAIAKFKNMVKAGHPREIVEQSMRMAQIDPKLLFPDAAPLTSSKPKDVTKYVNMLKAGHPREIVEQSMAIDGVDVSLLSASIQRPIAATASAENDNPPPPISARPKDLFATSTTTNNPAANGDPALAKYNRMLKAGLPRGAVEQSMTRDGIDPKLLFSDSSSITESNGNSEAPAEMITSNDPALAKYTRMLKAGLPRGAVEQSMTRDGVNPRLLFPDAPEAPSGPKYVRQEKKSTASAASSIGPSPNQSLMAALQGGHTLKPVSQEEREQKPKPSGASSIMDAISAGVQLRKTDGPVNKTSSSSSSSSNELLDAIRSGTVQLRKVEDSQRPENKTATRTTGAAASTGGGGVAAILARRMAIIGKNNGDSDDDDESGNSDWDDGE